MSASLDHKGPHADEAAIDSTPNVAVGTLVDDKLTTNELQQFGQTKRGLSPRHVQLMAIGGSIGTGLFVGIGSSLSNAGPLSLLLGYLFWGILFVWPCNLCVAEMCAWLPVRGTIFELASRYVDPAMGFALGWTYFFAGTMLMCTEYSAVATVIGYWAPEVNPAVWVAMAMVVCITLNVVAVKWYGESEFIMASTKILLLVGLILLTFITMLGGNPKGDRYGFRSWTNGNAMHAYYTSGATGRFLGFWSVVRYAAFTVAGPDLISLAAGEIRNPRRTIPRVARLVFYRLVGFYVIGVLAVGIICSSRDTRLLNALDAGTSGSAASPWVIGIENLSISGLPGLINALILLSGWSCGNAYLYSASRTLYSLARDAQAPRLFKKCTAAGVPVFAVTAVSLLACMTFLVASDSAITVLFWFINLTTIALILTYTGMLVTFVCWHRALRAQNISRSILPYRAPLAPYSAYLAIGVGCTVMLFIGFDVFEPWSTQGFITSYFGLAFGVVMFVGWKVVKCTHFVTAQKADVWSGKKEIDEECHEWEAGGIEENERRRLAGMTFLMRTWESMW
ncbi:AAT family amino acid transporter [Pseudovirgaria hyperparasitica]|uniref:AAT family amino acid transporter n=1 Tax=Pseudovirgaria hyperparasitica TaxID=470096 RepID=A0A6A6WCS9_9PEZI|nr:AAT family amino acid transporter [Pseudovirgaria hyperparasitica]KAF2758911.1 AAT family amino acid transporter [Pseudovirgaria hyperparasitica]